MGYGSDKFCFEEDAALSAAAPAGSRDAFGRWRTSHPGVSDQVWLGVSRLTGTTEDFYASMVTGEVP